MIKRIQKYLLLNHPLVWNVRFIPMLLILVALHFIGFVLSYVFTTHEFSEYGYYSIIGGSNWLEYISISMLTGILLVIAWLVYYSRNNAFKNLYPCKASQLFMEWIMIFVISIGVCCLPISMIYGNILKWRSMASLEEIDKVIETLHKTNVLLLAFGSHYYSSDGNFSFDPSVDKPIPVPDDMEINPDSVDLSLFSYHYVVNQTQKEPGNRMNDIVIDGYIGPSLLFYKPAYPYNVSKNDKEVLKMFHEGRINEIKAIMHDVEALHHKHKLMNAISADDWFDRIYNPPFFPADSTTFVSGRFHYSECPFIHKASLLNTYQHARQSHTDLNDLMDLIQVCLCLALCLSVAVFSFRITSGKLWLIAFIATGIVVFAEVFSTLLLLSVRYDHSNIDAGICTAAVLFWIVLFIVLVSRIMAKIRNKRNKGKSNVYMNVILWLVPCLFPLLFFTICLFIETLQMNYKSFPHEYSREMFWIDIPVTIILMWFICGVVRKWKAVADE